MRLFDHLDWHARERPNHPFAWFAGREISYREARDRSNQIANALLAEGLAPGARVAFLSKNCAEYALFYFGAAKAGVVPVPLNFRLAPAEWSYIVNDAGAELLFARGALAGAIDPVRRELGSVKRCLALDATPPPGWEAYEPWVARAATSAPERFVADSADVYQMYTSGTTGRPKGAILQHRSVTANAAQIGSVTSLGHGDRYLVVAPMYHAAAAVSSFWIVQEGGCLYILEDFVPAEVVRVLSEEGIVAGTLVPAMIQACLVGVPDVAQRRYESLRTIIYGASPIAVETLRRAIEVFGCGFAQGFGMTETTAAATFLLMSDHERALRGKPELLLSCGRALPGTDVIIAGPDDAELPRGEIGEILVRGPQVMRGYWNLEGPSAEALRGGWMHTGDAASMDDEGYVFIQDRLKDMIVSGGENVYPREVEDVLFKHPAVADAAVIGVPDAQWGEVVKAIVVLRKGAQATEAELIDHARQSLASYKRPRSVDFIAELPRNPSGKVLKKDLREPYWKGHARRVS
ncbi:MAG TPA: long-chain-fatty-acid--CoA ligase [Myxococcota bacterium]|nr:long-chain-fatty-acid--CoA ligase [Myxococcota bacterium]